MTAKLKRFHCSLRFAKNGPKNVTSGNTNRIGTQNDMTTSERKMLRRKNYETKAKVFPSRQPGHRRHPAGNQAARCGFSLVTHTFASSPNQLALRTPPGVYVLDKTLIESAMNNTGSNIG